MVKYFFIILMIVSISFADGPRKKHRKWIQKKHHRIHKVKKYPKLHRSRASFSVRYGFHWCLTPWRNFHSAHHHNDIIVVRDQNISELNNMEIFEQIEKLGELKDQGLITEKEFEKAKKDLLKKI